MSKEVGSGHVAIFPVMNGFRQKTRREFDAAAAEGSTSFKKAFGRAGTDTGDTLGRGVKAAFGRHEIATPGLKRLQSEVSSASSALSKARLKQQDAAGRARAAEARLTSAQTAAKSASEALTRAEKNAVSAREKYGTGSKQAESAEKKLETARNRVASTSAQVVAAEESLASAQRKASAATDTVEAASNRLAKAQKALTSVTETSSSKMGAFGRTMESFKAGWSGALTPATSAFQNLAQSAGQHLHTISNTAGDVASKIISPFKTVGSKIGGFIAPISKAFTPIGSIAASTGKALLSNIGGALKSIGTMALAAAGIIAGAFAKSISSAVERVDTLNNFPKVMSNLGYSAQDAEMSISKLSDGIDGLPTKLDEIAGTTQQLAPLTSSLDEATDLSLALNNAFLAGGKGTAEAARGMTQYTQMLATGKVDMMSWRTLQETMPGQLNQISIALLGAGASTTDLYEAMQSGEVTFDDFNSAILDLNKNGVEGFASFEQQAKDSTQGIATSWQNVKTALTKGTASIIEAIGIENITGAFDKLKAVIGSVSDKVASGIEKLKSSPGLSEFTESLKTMGLFAATALAPLLSHIPVVGKAFAGLTGPVALTIGLLIGLFAESEALRDAVKSLIEQVGPALTGAFETLAPVLESVSEAFTGVLETVGDALASVVEAAIPIITTIIEIITDLAAQVLPMLTPILEQIGELITTVADIIVTHVIPVVEGLLPIVQNILEAIVGVVGSALETISAVISTVTALIAGDWSGAWEGIKGIISGVWETIKSIVSAAIEIIRGVISGVLTTIASLWSTNWGNIASFVTNIWETIKRGISNGLNAISSFISSGLSRITSAWSNGWNSAKQIVSNAWNQMKSAVSSGISNVIGLVRQLPSKVVSALGNLGSVLFSSGQALLRGFGNGITSAFSGIKNKVSSGLSSIRNLFPFSPAKEGPFSGRGWVKYSGESIPPAFAEGIRTQIPAAVSAARDLAGATSTALDGTTGAPSYGPLTAHPTGGPGSAGVVFNIGAINNPQAEPTSTTLSRELSRVAAGVDALV